MNPALMQSLLRTRRRRAASASEADSEERKTLSPGETVSNLLESGPEIREFAEKLTFKKAPAKAVGFWAIPSGESYVKLKILSSYSIKRDDAEGVRKVGLKTGGKLLPVWPALSGVDTLGKYFAWLPKKIKELTPDKLTKEDAPGHLEALLALQKLLLDEGWVFVIPSGNTVIVGASEDTDEIPFWEKLVRELLGGEKQMPYSVALDVSGLKTIALVGYNGDVKKKLDVEPIQQAFADESLTRDIDDFVQSAEKMSSHKFAQFLADKDKLVRIIVTAYRTGREADFTDAVRKMFDTQRQSMDWTLEELDDFVTAFMDIYAEAKKKLIESSKVRENGIVEVTFRKLWGLTTQNGNYRKGGMVLFSRVNAQGQRISSWGYDPNVKGRVENGTRFVVKRPPKASIAADGNPQLLYNFKSRPDRSTTGMRQKGYIKFLPERKGIWKRFTQIFAKSNPEVNEWDRDIHVFCTCPDFKYRWHKALYDAGASHQPQGGAEATNVDPVKTNPGKKLSLCKHQVAAAAYLTMSKKAYDDIEKQQKAMAKAGIKTIPGIAHPPVIMRGKTPEVDVI